jgi:hypothetical protein
MNLDLAKLLNQDIPAWWPNWHGKTCIIVAGGPSAKDQDYDLARRAGLRAIVVNNAHALAPWADALFACDLAWWRRYGPALSFEGLRLSTDKNACEPRQPWGVQRVGLDRPSDRLNLVRYNHVGWGGNSGFQALNLAIQFGATKILLAGYDMTTAHGLHWHGAHPSGMNNPSEPNIARWRRAIEAAADDIGKLGIEVINLSPISTLTRYPKMTLAEALSA